ncbi:putative GNAT family N-acetyltransferase [Lasiosphaeria miniovina]|uniref:GNAT family N-acetyltransferase n=1 Tax=Lasiosphaeria miniovina TaxID=1954250 RepID=A0AA40AJY4_9PEZI|nr:putative GNAT family N-acetyltransferase [Lasiosphaeria miniovina]KAK0717271.1 putative GNAT family N-acetyltransferase [Lasiosphaeria miniovina]
MSTSPAPPMAKPLPEGYALQIGIPPPDDYLNLRAGSGLTPKNAAQAAAVASGSWYGCYATYTPPPSNDQPAPAPAIVGMGRIVGDGAWCFHIADMAVLTAHQRKGLGDAILKTLLAHIQAVAPEGLPFVNLFADPPGRRLYAQNGFVESAPEELGMQLPRTWVVQRGEGN